MTYNGLLNQTIRIYKTQGAMEAFRFISREGDIPGNDAQICNFRYSLASGAGLAGDAIAIMREGVLEKGYWYANDYLKQDEDLSPLFHNPDFIELVSVCREREAAAKLKEKPSLKIKKLEGKENDTAVIVLHGNMLNNELEEPYWKGVNVTGCTLALAQSSVIRFTDAYIWSDVNKGRTELETHAKTLRQQGFPKLIFGGFSAGARVALQTAVHSNIPPAGLILNGPWLPGLKEEEVALLKKKDCKVFAVCGDDDEDCFALTNEFVNMLKKHNIPCRYTVIPGLDHDYPENFDALVTEAVAFILDE